MAPPDRTWRAVPRPRSRLPGYFAGTTGVVLLLLTGLLLGHAQFCRQAVVAGMGLTLGALLHGVCLLAEESLFHLATRYRNSLPRMLRACFSGGPLLVGVVVVLVLWAGSLQLDGAEWCVVAMTSGVSLLIKALGILNPTPVELSEICEQRKMNVAHGLAWAFYTGYLKLVLPRLEDCIERYHQLNRKSSVLQDRDSHRLHILVPLSAFIPNKLEETDPHVRFYDNLPEIVMDRAGVRERVYKHSVYCLQDEQGQEQHFLAEFATPLQTVYQMSQDSSAGLSPEERRQQVLLFIRTLQAILDQSVECHNRFQLLILDDECEQEGEQDAHFLSKAIRKQLRQQAREEYGVAPPREHPACPEPLSRNPTLMISEDYPCPLRVPVETDWSPKRH